MDDRMPWFPCYPSNLLGALAGMKPPEGYLYTIILLRIYESGGACPDSLDALATRSRYSKRVVSDALDSLFKAGRLYRGEGGIRNPKSDQVVTESKERIRVKSICGEGGARQKWNSKKRSERLSAARKIATHSAEEWTAMLQVCGPRCLRCNAERKLVKDHITPIYQGGSDGIDNIQPLCASCNSGKGPEVKDHRPPSWKTSIVSIIDAWQTPAKTPETPAYLHLQEQDSLFSKENRVPASKTGGRPTKVKAIPKPDVKTDWPPDHRDQFWDAYPRHTEKKAAMTKLDAVRRSGLSWDRFIAGVHRYRDHVRSARTEERFIKHPTTWLNRGCWDDELKGGGSNEANRDGAGKVGFSGLAAKLRQQIRDEELLDRRPAPEDLQPVNGR